VNLLIKHKKLLRMEKPLVEVAHNSECSCKGMPKCDWCVELIVLHHTLNVHFT
jgi:hypothetical protein